MELERDEREKPASPAAMLASRARIARKRSGLSLRALAAKLGFPHTYLARVESGEQLPSPALAETMDAYYKADGLFTDLLAMAIATQAEIPRWGRKVLEAEKRAVRIRTFNSSVVPGLLQTEAYATALYAGSMLDRGVEDIASHVTRRVHRQAVLETLDSPDYWAVIDEAALRRAVGNAAVMAGQIRHILQVLERCSSVHVQVLPFSTGMHPLMGGSLSLLDLRGGSTFAYVESFASGASVKRRDEVMELTKLFEVARSKALEEGQSMVLLHECLKEYEEEC